VPRFDYKCDKCGHRFEGFVDKWDDVVDCSACGGVMTKQYGRFSVVMGGVRVDKRSYSKRDCEALIEGEY
jgi:putative FmdB family regulatory protein